MGFFLLSVLSLHDKEERLNHCPLVIGPLTPSVGLVLRSGRRISVRPSKSLKDTFLITPATREMLNASLLNNALVKA